MVVSVFFFFLVQFSVLYLYFRIISFFYYFVFPFVRWDPRLYETILLHKAN